MKDRYCWKCGTKLLLTKYIMGFDPYTGKKIEYLRGICPLKKWWNDHEKWDEADNIRY